MPQLGTHERADISDKNKGKQSGRRALRGSIRNQETTQEANGRVTRRCLRT